MKKFLAISLILALGASLHGLLFHNDLIGAFPEGQDRAQIENHVIEGATHFFISKAHADLLFKEYEQSATAELNKSQAAAHADNALAELKLALDNYHHAADIAGRIGYVQDKRQHFKDFDYSQLAEHLNLDRHIAGQVESYLSRGDIVGIYQKNIDNLEALAVTLGQIRDTLKSGGEPGIQTVWTLVRQYSETLLFGNYATMMGTSAMAGNN